ncbi:MAG: 4-(cytidine 5'-diphospho)-2-C-methyl-D-erythritol kinase [Oscillospiraceae bacterium]|nr:4-(cytidine 5'-diphospho)-2-C-methyl-D-erythritol kinase [Oscillospiraceae bacterium]
MSRWNFKHDKASVRSPGKINLTLDITGKRSDGYHNIESVMHSIGLCDTVSLNFCGGGQIRVSCPHPDVPEDEDNIAYRAAELFFSRMEIPMRGLHLHIEKALPVQAGLAGGSANAAAVLVGLDFMCGTDLTLEKLMALGAELGADVPFCIAGGCKLARGKGELLTDITGLPPCTLLIAKPKDGVSTGQAFAQYAKYNGTLRRPDNPAMLRALESGVLAEIGKYMINVFEQLVPIPEVREIKKAMLANGAEGAAMTGSGSAAAGIFAEESAARFCGSRLKNTAAEIFITSPCQYGAEVIRAI